MMADFLYAFFPERMREEEVFLKISRYNYIRYVGERMHIYIYMGNIPDEYIKLHQKLLIGLVDKKILKKEILRMRDAEGKFSTHINFQLVLKSSPNSNNVRAISLIPYNTIFIDNKLYSFSSFRNLILAKRKKKEMREVIIPLDGIIRANNIAYIMDREAIKLNDLLLKNELGKILGGSGSKNIEDFLKRMRKISKDVRFALKWSKMGTENLEEMKCLVKDMSLEIEPFLKGFKSILNFDILEKDFSKEKFYIPNFIDNRGRQYYSSNISPTFNPIFRNLLKFGNEKKPFLNLKTSKFYNKIMENRNIINDVEDEEKIYIMLVLFYEIGKFFIKNKKKIIFSMSEIIEIGIKNEDVRTFLEIEEELYLAKIKQNIAIIRKNGKVDTEMLIFKDATASGLQNFGILLGYKLSHLKFLNLEGDY
jgi:hypothetical protein